MKLRDYQRDLADKGLTIVKDYGMVYYSVEMRVGKTFTGLTVAHEYGAKNVLVITKPSAMKDMKKDVKAFKKSVGKDMQFTVANYERLACIAWSLENLTVGGKHDFDLVIVDEAHTLGAFPKPSSQTKYMKEFTGDLPVIYLSGTPTPESWSQIFHQFWISSNSPFKKYKTFYAWAKVYVDKKEKMIHGIRIADYSKADQAKIERETSHLFLSYTQAEAGFVGEVKERREYVEVDKRIPQLINQFLNDRMYTMKNGDVILGDTGAKLKSKVHQMCSGTVITEDEGYVVLDRSKAEYIKKNYSDKKAVVFYVYNAEGMALRSVLSNIVETRDEFDASKKPCFLIKQVVSGARGVDLSSADILIYYNIMFSSEIYQQSRARTQTKDKTSDSPVVWLFSDMPESIEDKIYKVVQNKQDYSAYYFKRDYKLK